MDKKFTDMTAMAALIIALATGFVLHVQVHHRFVYDDSLMWTIHEIAGIVFALCVILHCFQHNFWFKNFRKIPVLKKRATTILLIFVMAVAVSGIVLLCGSHSHFASEFHYICAIVMSLLAIGHVVKRWKIFMTIGSKTIQSRK